METTINTGISCNHGPETEARVNTSNNLKGPIRDAIVNSLLAVNKTAKPFHNGNFNNCAGGHEAVIGCKKVDGIDEIKRTVGC